MEEKLVVRPPPPPLRPQRQLARQLIGGRSDRAGKSAKMGQKVPKKKVRKMPLTTKMGLKVESSFEQKSNIYDITRAKQVKYIHLTI